MVASAASMSFKSTRGAHPTTRMDSFLRATDASFQHAETQVQGDRFVRKMATYGQVRPSVSFTSESRVTRPVHSHSAVDMCSLPNPALNPRGDPREGTLEYKTPPTPNAEFIRLMENKKLMLPSERFREHLEIRAKKKQFDEDKQAGFRYHKGLKVLQHHYPHGVIGVDGPMYADTVLYRERRAHVMAQAEAAQMHAEQRHAHLAERWAADDATAARVYGEPHDQPRSHDIGAQRKCVDPVLHPVRFQNTHERLFPKHTPTWDPERAHAQRSHDVRERRHNIITGADNNLTFRVAGAPQPVQHEPGNGARSQRSVSFS